MKCDVIIPAYNRASTLRETLVALSRSHLPRPSWTLRILVSDDGSTDDIETAIQALSLPRPWSLTIISGEHAGPAASRNRALAQARADVIFFLGADILLQPEALAHHLTFHEQHQGAHEAALGMVKWDPRLPPTPLMEWMMHGGQQNDFDSLLGETQADPAHFFYASHLSLKRHILSRARFPEELDSYGWEDLSLGRTLGGQGITLHILHAAVGLHRHFYSLSAIAERQQAVGLSLKSYQAVHPDVSLPRPSSQAAYFFRALFILLGGQAALRVFLALFQKVSFPWLFLVFTSNAFWQGVWRSHGGLLAFLRRKVAFFK
ncbi:MAG: glycosyltransferase family A protein [Patescibacteria group bacterium]